MFRVSTDISGSGNGHSGLSIQYSPTGVCRLQESLSVYLRYVDWTGGGSNPKVLTLDDLPELVKTGAHFARKFDERVDVAILDELDQLIG